MIFVGVNNHIQYDWEGRVHRGCARMPLCIRRDLIHQFVENPGDVVPLNPQADLPYIY